MRCTDPRAEGRRALQGTARRAASGSRGRTKEGKPEAGQRKPSRREGQGAGTKGARAVGGHHGGVLGA